MAKGKLTKDRQYHGQRETDKRQTISWPKWNWLNTDNIIAKGKLTKTANIMAIGKMTKDRQYHGQWEADKRQTISWS
jgi:hypothetical protein